MVPILATELATQQLHAAVESRDATGLRDAIRVAEEDSKVDKALLQVRALRAQSTSAHHAYFESALLVPHRSRH